jgi:phosphoesterase RecJ-like protein
MIIRTPRPALASSTSSTSSAPSTSSTPSVTSAATSNGRSVSHRQHDVFVQGHPSAVVMTTATAATAALPAIPARRLPPLREAIVDTTLHALPPESVPVPVAILDVLRSATRILVIGHVPPDGDCVGSAAGLVAALQAMGKDAVAVVDDALPASSRAIDSRGLVQRAADVDGSFDAVVLVDVAQRTRIGGAARFLDGADHVVVIDHHEDVPDAVTFGLGAHQQLTSWVAPDTDAAAVLVAGIACALRPGDDGPFQAAAPMLASSMYTDTLGFRAPGTDLRTLQLFKGVVSDLTRLDALEAALTPSLPPATQAIIDALVVDVGSSREGGRATFSVSRTTWQQLLDTARAVDPKITEGDVRGALCDRLDDLRDLHGVSAMVLDEAAGVRVSIRSIDDGLASRVATRLGGGGHGRAAAAFIVDADASTVGERLAHGFHQEHLATSALLRSGRLSAPAAPASSS